MWTFHCACGGSDRSASDPLVPTSVRRSTPAAFIAGTRVASAQPSMTSVHAISTTIGRRMSLCMKKPPPVIPGRGCLNCPVGAMVSLILPRQGEVAGACLTEGEDTEPTLSPPPPPSLRATSPLRGRM
ncbi:hypothetical protein SPHINGO391_480209 [Sphingomonas aurantiaca]|uniref:Uncharacterized protein n=1 Tax=Sphingomonas aurantiaca TaxID=185949 RepID=A0A5E8A6T9_9SPHN|nr:hypothetical protein SPHINGO391_480209 [Sphingomonas aurantiaca]